MDNLRKDGALGLNVALVNRAFRSLVKTAHEGSIVTNENNEDLFWCLEQAELSFNFDLKRKLIAMGIRDHKFGPEHFEKYNIDIIMAVVEDLLFEKDDVTRLPMHIDNILLGDDTVTKRALLRHGAISKKLYARIVYSLVKKEDLDGLTRFNDMMGNGPIISQIPAYNEVIRKAAFETGNTVMIETIMDGRYSFSASAELSRIAAKNGDRDLLAWCSDTFNISEDYSVINGAVEGGQLDLLR